MIAEYSDKNPLPPIRSHWVGERGAEGGVRGYSQSKKSTTSATIICKDQYSVGRQFIRSIINGPNLYLQS
jgi:hypothetical protein